MESKYDIQKRYCHEISDILEIIDQFKTGRIYGYNNNLCKSDGNMSFNADKLEKLIKSLIVKIECDLPSTMDEVGIALKDANI